MVEDKEIAEVKAKVVSITNEMAKTLYPTLASLIVSLECIEESKEVPDKSRLGFYSEIGDILMEEHRNFPNFTDEEIDYKVSILSAIIKDMVISDVSLHHKILELNVDKLKNL